MADALQMFLMAGSSLQLGAHPAAKAADGETPLLADSLPFADTLAEAGEQPSVLAERQKAAVPAAQAEQVVAESVNPESLQAILTDELSSADEKDAARAWLAIIRAGQQERAGITLTAAAAASGQQSAAESPSTHSKLASLLQPSERLAAAEHATEAKETKETKQGSQGDTALRLLARAKASQTLAADSASAKASSLTEKTAADAASQRAVAAATQAAAQADEHESLADEDTETIANKDATDRQNASKASADAHELTAKKAASVVAGADNTDLKSQDATKAANKSDKAAAPDSPLASQIQAAVKEEQASDNTIPPQLIKQLASESLVPAASSAPTASSKVVATGIIAATKLETPLIGADAAPQLLASDAAELVAASALNTAIPTDATSSAQALAGAVQARAEALGSITQATAQSGEQKSGEQKEQSTASAVLSAMQQAQAEKGQASGARFDATAEQEQPVSESGLQAAVSSSQSSSNLGSGGSGITSQPAASVASTAQLVQSQGSSLVQPASASASVSELLRQPFNLLAADASGQLRERLVMMVRNSVHSAEIKLDPAELGSMHIRVSMQQDQASVQFLVQQAHAKEILEQQLPRLRDMLGEQGIELADGQVAQQDSGQQQQQAAGGNARTEDEEAPMQEQRLAVAKPSNRLVDYYA